MRIIVTILLVIILIRLLAPTVIRLFFFGFVPWLIKRNLGSHDTNFREKHKTSEGTISIKHIPQKKSGTEKFKDEGDFVDYEEVK
ncbi:MAG: hypothetical protein A3H98_05875 [Bacteroidetes bacterium RIFCSPLOWO2_02_FULL_36_8]|nr:MAG: hypothetical protein A3H98_05875 [Bacteroidetes bacterium RIFCSPLOWO2_02_FULL_36_8]OFY68960.1 MAG: hypothetical protein A3G23_10390 [Bacteroidetes bacterium RIFCSPLOWO2_12_FULL_37_12]